MNKIVAVGVALLAFGVGGLAMAKGRRPTSKKATVDGRPYVVYKLGGGHYSVERRDTTDPTKTIASLELTAEDPPEILNESGVPWAIDLMRADVYRFPPDLFDEPIPPPVDSPVGYAKASEL